MTSAALRRHTGRFERQSVHQNLPQARALVRVETIEPRRLFSSAPLAVFADVTGDGLTDLVMATKKSGDGAIGPHITIQTGVGDGTFGLPVTQTLAASPLAVAAGDVNGDNAADILVAAKTKGGTALRVFVNGTGGAFTPTDATVPLAGSTYLLGDVTGDGNADLVVLKKNAAGVAPSNGDGTFNATTATPLAALGVDFGPGPAVADVNGDGNADLVGFGREGIVHIAPGTVDGIFGPSIDLDIGLAGQKVARSKFSVAVGDVNGDGNDDLVLLPAKKGVPVFLADGNGDGTFDPAVQAFLNSTAVLPEFVGIGFSTKGQFTLAVADVDAGGAADLIGLERKPTAADPVAFVALDNGKGFGRPVLATTFAGKLDANQPALAGDINGDGKDDLLSFAAGRKGAGTVLIQINRGKGIFDDPFFFNLPAGTLPKGSLVKLGDFNGDDKTDAIVIEIPRKGATTLNTRVLIGLGDGTFAAPVARPINGILPYIEQDIRSRIFVGDLNADGKDDLLFLPRPGVVSSDAYFVSITDGTSNTVVTMLQANPFPGNVLISSYDVGDFNGDGFLDLAAFGLPSGDSLPVSLCLGDGSVRFVDGSVRFGPPATFSNHTGGVNFNTTAKPLLADVNGDGRTDLVVIMQSVTKQITAATTSPAFVALANTNGALGNLFQASRFVAPGGNVPLAADVNGDGRSDLVSISDVASKSAHIITFTLAKIDGTFGQRVSA